MSDMTRRDHYICAALIGLMAAEDGAPSPEMMANGAVHLADAALAAAGEQVPDLRGHITMLMDRNLEMEAEIARVAKLVEALEAIEQGPPLTLKGAQEIARAALDEFKGGEK